MKATNQKKKTKEATLLGIGLDNQDGHTRLTRGKNFVLYGGSEETHGQMQETVIKVTEHLDRRGKRLEDVSAPDLLKIFREVTE